MAAYYDQGDSGILLDFSIFYPNIVAKTEQYQ